MDRYVIRERRADQGHLMGNQMIAFSPTTGGNDITMQQNPGLQCLGNYIQQPQNIISMQNYGNVPNQSKVSSGIDTRYLANFGDNNAAYIAGISGMQVQMEPNAIPLNAFDDYQNRSFVGAQKLVNKPYLQRPTGFNYTDMQKTYQSPKDYKQELGIYNNTMKTPTNVPASTPKIPTPTVETSKKEIQSQNKSKLELQKELYKTGSRVFTGTVENVMKWHKSLQDIGILIFYEIVAKLVNVRQGDSCAKNLVVRDENGPAMQIVYYEIDFLLPEMKPPCTVRVIGRMISGTSRFQAFSVRSATGDDVAMLPRRAAIATHHVNKLNKEYGFNK